MSSVGSGLAFLLILVMLLRKSTLCFLILPPAKWPPSVHLYVFFGLGVLFYLIHSLVLLFNPPTSYMFREFLHCSVYPLCFFGIRPYLSNIVNMAANIDSDRVHYGLRKRTVLRLIHSIAPVSALGALVSIISFAAIDYSLPHVNQWLTTLSCVIFLYPCILLSWCCYEYGARFSRIVDTELKEARVVSDHFWHTTHLKPHDTSSPFFIQIAHIINTMKSVYLVFLLGATISIFHLAILAVLPVDLYRHAIFSEIFFFSFHVINASLFLWVITYILYQELGQTWRHVRRRRAAAKSIIMIKENDTSHIQPCKPQEDMGYHALSKDHLSPLPPSPVVQAFWSRTEIYSLPGTFQESPWTV
ncbi:MAG: hypothetical protein DHS80DRAFT_24178 [Piptocephalis tieghemiana]|nr:MAG: hypothetical protein DHS80DRAFT_24178 [Piptocephalis tieghemiana]